MGRCVMEQRHVASLHASSQDAMFRPPQPVTEAETGHNEWDVKNDM
jgi:hypothetical protein